MVNFNCPRCCYSTIKKSNIIRHINRKSVCKLVRLDIIPINYRSIILKEDGSEFEIVDKLFKLEKENKELKEKFEKLDTQVKTINNTTNSNNNITTNNNNITIVLRPVHDPECEFLTDGDYKQCLNRMIMSIPNLIRKIHFNPKHPENHNLYIPNIQQKYAMLYNGKEWQLKNTEDTIDKLLRNHEMMLEEWIDCGGDEFPQAMKNFKTYLEKREENGVEDTIKEEIKLLLYNKRKMIKDRVL